MVRGGEGCGRAGLLIHLRALISFMTLHSCESVRKQEDAMDRRQRKSRRAITDAFVELMLQKRYDQVTVATIINRADIARSTFYAHFETKDELLRSLCEEMFNHIFGEVSQSPNACESLYVGLRGQLVHLLFHLRNNHEGVCAKLVSEGEPCYTGYFETRFVDLFHSKIRPREAYRCSCNRLSRQRIHKCRSLVVRRWACNGSGGTYEQNRVCFAG